MPCYDPPPEWEGAAKEDGRQAARLLCGIVGDALKRGEDVSIPLMRWYIGHRHVDLRMIADPRMQLKDDPGAIRAEIARVEELVEKALDRMIRTLGHPT